MDKFNIDGHKLGYHVERIAQWERDPFNTFPIYVEVSPVGWCNHKCSFCALDFMGGGYTKLEPMALYVNVMSMANAGVKSIMYAGEGEPLLHPKIAEIVKFTKGHGIDVAITTNGTALTRKFCDGALIHCSWIKISCNAGSPVIYNEMHGCLEGHWDLVWENIKYAVKVRDEKGYDTVIGVQCMLLPENAHTLINLAKKCRQTGVDYLVIKPYSQHPSSKTQKYADLQYGSVYDKYLDVLQVYASDRFEVITRVKPNGEGRGDSKCLSVPYFWAYMTSTGDVYGCSSFIGDHRFLYGNINDEIFHKIWRGDRRGEAVEYMKGFDANGCRERCRMHKCNEYLRGLMDGGKHVNFI